MTLTPGREQYLRLKAEHPDAVLLYRMGDFYEMFDEDAHTAARVLGITLTSREFGKSSGRVPMAGIPHHALNGYLRRFLRAGYRLAICEQLSEPGKGLVERDVTRVLSPGTVDDPSLLDAKRPNYLLAIAAHGALIGLAWVDVSTGASEYRVMPADEPAPVTAFIEQLAPAEIIGPVADDLGVLESFTIRPIDGDWSLDDAERSFSHRFPACEPPRPAALRATAILIGYLSRGHAALLDALDAPIPFDSTGIMLLDRQTRLNLEIDLRQRDRIDLFGLLNATKTAPGARRLHAILERPLCDRATIERRLDAVAELHADATLRLRLGKALAPVLDLERLATRVATRAIRSRELLSLAETLAAADRVRALLDGRVRSALLREAVAEIETLPRIQGRINAALDAESSRLLLPGNDTRLDALYQQIDADRSFIQSLQQVERDRTGIRSLKIGYNKVFGYYFEVSRANRVAVPDDFTRKQTLTNAERYISPALKEAEARILAAEERASELETELYTALIRDLAAHVTAMRATAHALATIDVVNALATVAADHRWTRPILTDDDDLSVVEGRHPIVERELPVGAFVPNDTLLTGPDGHVVILTGPNMAGKSTWLRQVALIVFLAQTGSFVPASRARIGLVDRIFTRIGAHDDLARGQSTFMVEMLETATILQHATSRSLVVLDEIGRGTSTEDGVAIAGAVVTDLAERVGCRTLFATHFRELSALADTLPDARTMQTAIEQRDGQFVFLHTIIPGVAEAAFGLEIARLAGIPEPVLAHARRSVEQTTVLAELPTRHVAEASLTYTLSQPAIDLARERIITDILALDLARTTPLDALNLLAGIQDRLRAEEPIGPRVLDGIEARRAASQAD
jgi:DNA mismatch repair protein MutS